MFKNLFTENLQNFVFKKLNDFVDSKLEKIKQEEVAKPPIKLAIVCAYASNETELKDLELKLKSRNYVIQLKTTNLKEIPKGADVVMHSVSILGSTQLERFNKLKELTSINKIIFLKEGEVPFAFIKTLFETKVKSPNKRGRLKKISTETIEKAKDLREKGYSFKNISKELNLNQSSIYPYLKNTKKGNKVKKEKDFVKEIFKEMKKEEPVSC